MASTPISGEAAPVTLPGTLPTDRRSVLWGFPAIAAAASLPGIAVAATRDRRAWDAAMRRHHEAKLASEHYAATVADPAYARQLAFEKAHGLDPAAFLYWHERRQLLEQHPGYRIPDAVDEHSERLGRECSEAEDALMAMPAPDAAALRWKLDTIIEPEGETTPAWSMSYVRQAIADYRRLLGDA